MAEPFNIIVSMTVITCAKGHFYAVPHWVGSANYQCPFCANETVTFKNSLIGQQQRTISHYERVIHGLRGALSRTKRRIK